MTRFLLIRHATTEAIGVRLAGRMAGVRLDEQGRKQAQALAERLAPVPIDAVYSSPLERTVETADAIARLRGLEVFTREDLLELDFGEWTNSTFESLRDDPLFNRFNQLRSCTPAPGGEHMLQAQARVVLTLEQLRSRHPRQSVAVVSHGDVIRAAVAYYAGIPLDLFQRIEITPASVSALDIDEHAVRIRVVNDVANWGGLAG